MCFKNLQISEKSSIFALNFSNLRHVKYVFMKNKDKIKLVYRLNSESMYVRAISGGYKYLHLDFPVLINFYPAAPERLFRCDFVTNKYKGKAWIDKHLNVIVRLDNNKQTKLNF